MPLGDTFCLFVFWDGLLGRVYVPCLYRMPGGVIVGDSGLCCCVPVQCVTSIVRAQLLQALFVESTLNLSRSHSVSIIHSEASLYMCVYLLSQFLDQRTMSDFELKMVLL